MKKILIFSLAYYPKHVGGAEIAIKEITNRISPKEIEFYMVTLRFDSTLPKTEKIGNIFVHRIGFTRKNPSVADLKKFPLSLNKLLFQFLAAWEAHKLHKKNHYDGIWAMMAHSCGVPAAIFKMFHPKVPYLLTLQEGDPPEYIQKKMRPLYPLFKRAFTKADFVQTISTFLAKWARRMGYAGHIELVPNGFDSWWFSENPLGNKKVFWRNHGDIPQEGPILITVSRLVYKNAVDTIIRALALLPNNFCLAVLGSGPDKSKLEELAAELNVENRVRFYGEIPNTRIVGYLHASDIFVRPSRSEGMGNSFIEAMAAGLPVIATQEGGIADFLFDAERNPDKETTGWAVDKDSPEQIALAVKDILAYPEQVARVKATAQTLVLEKYNWDKIVKDMKERVFYRLFTKSK